MANKIAILHVPHEQCELSLQEMLQSVGYKVYGIGRDLAHRFNLHMIPVVASRLPEKAGLGHFRECDLFVTVKHYNLPSIHKRHNNVVGKVLWFDINGGIPGEHIVRDPKKSYPLQVPVPYVSANKRYLEGNGFKVSGPRYICYIPLADRKTFLAASYSRVITQPPVALVHNPSSWGYGWIVDSLKAKYGVKFYGSHGAPDGRVEYTQVPSILSSALCMVHAKSRDCPGCALYESLLAGCPVILTDVFIQRTLFTDLYKHGETCLIVRDEATIPIEERTARLVEGISSCIERLKDPAENKRIGFNGQKRLLELMWRSERKSDVESFKKFMQEQFP